MSGKDTLLPSNRRSRASIWIAFGLLFVVAATVIWWLCIPAVNGIDVVDTSSDQVPVAPVQAHAGSTADGNRGNDIASVGGNSGNSAKLPSPRRDNQRKPFLFDNSTPTADAVKTLLPLAQSGRADAMNEMAFRLNQCTEFVDRDETSIRRDVLKHFYSQAGHEPASEAELGRVATWINNGTAMVERCRGLDPALMATRIQWMERAAHAGDIAALLFYGTNALKDMRGPDDILMRFDEVTRRRQLARSFLQTALNRGACDALVTFSQAYSGRRGSYEWMFTPDPYLSLVYAEAAVRAGIKSSVSPQTLAGIADPARLAAAASQGAALAARHCNK